MMVRQTTNTFRNKNKNRNKHEKAYLFNGGTGYDSHDIHKL